MIHNSSESDSTYKTLDNSSESDYTYKPLDNSSESDSVGELHDEPNFANNLIYKSRESCSVDIQPDKHNSVDNSINYNDSGYASITNSNNSGESSELSSASKTLDESASITNSNNSESSELSSVSKTLDESASITNSNNSGEYSELYSASKTLDESASITNSNNSESDFLDESHFIDNNGQFITIDNNSKHNFVDDSIHENCLPISDSISLKENATCSSDNSASVANFIHSSSDNSASASASVDNFIHSSSDNSASVANFIHSSSSDKPISDSVSLKENVTCSSDKPIIVNNLKDLLTNCELGNLIDIEHCIRNHININCKNSSGNTPLILAVKSKNIHLVERLIQHDECDVSYMNNKKNALMILIEMESFDYKANVVKTLAKKTIKAMDKDIHLKYKKSYLLVECLYDNYFKEENKHNDYFSDKSLHILRILIENGLCQNSFIYHQYTILTFAIEKECSKIVEQLVKCNIDLDQCDNKFHTPLTYAIYRGNCEILSILINNGANLYFIYKKYSDDYHPRSFSSLSYAVFINKVEIVKKLIYIHKADLYKCGRNNFTPLESLVLNDVNYSEKHTMLSVLHNNNINIDYEHEGETALKLAIRNKKKLSVELLICFSASVDGIKMPLFEFIDIRADLKKRDTENINIKNIMLQQLINYNKFILASNSIVLINAISNRDIETATIFIEYGANVNITDEKGNTPLIHAVSIKNIDIINKLIKLNAHINIANQEGVTALKHAYKIKKFLLIVLMHAKTVKEKGSGLDKILFIHITITIIITIIMDIVLILMNQTL